MSATSLADAIWDGDLPAMSCTPCSRSFHGSAGAGDAGLSCRAPAVPLAVDPEDVDARRFERLAAEGAASLGRGSRARRETLSGALALWRGPALGDLAAGEAFVAAAARLEDLRVTARADRAEAEIALGRAPAGG